MKDAPRPGRGALTRPRHHHTIAAMNAFPMTIAKQWRLDI